MWLFIWHQILGQVRSVFWKKKLIIGILTAFFYLYLSVSIILTGYFFDVFVEKLFPGDDPLERSTQLLFYYFILDIIVRLLLQRLPEIALQYYALLPVKKSTLIHYPLVGSLTSIFNLLPLIIIMVFFFKQVAYSLPLYEGLVWLTIMFSRVFINNYAVFALKKRLERNPWLLALSSMIFTSVLLADILEYIALSKYWYETVYFVMDRPYLVFIPLLILALIYLLAYLTMSAYYYPEEYNSFEKPVPKQLRISSWFYRFGSVGRLVEVEIKLILRNKRPRTFLVLSILFIAYFYTSAYNISSLVQDGKATVFTYVLMIAFFVFATGWFMMIYGQLLFAWESSYFDGLLAMNIRPVDYIKAKFWLIFLQNAVSLVVILPSILVDTMIFYTGIACLLFNIGITSYLIILSGMYNTSKVDANKTAFMNYQGANVIHFLIVIILVGLPLAIFLPFDLIGKQKLGIAVIGLLGLAGCLMSKFFIGRIAGFFRSRRYILAKGYKDY